MKTKTNQSITPDLNLLNRKLRLCLVAFVLFCMALPHATFAGQNWTLTITNNNAQTAYYQGYTNEACWYPMDLGSSFTIGNGATITKNTEEKWAIFNDCGGGDSYITLNFLVFGSSGYAVAFTVTFVDTYEHAPPATNPLSCSYNGYGQTTAVGWSWVNGAPPGASDPVISCGKSGDSSTTNVSLTLPSF